ncbi:hypothetical protein JOF56_003684 [Kibdelosporangium banguiense]|uniref:Uncharacterized protein n=1 Tax=Kibdelosporangium banguiense TaxID=1365924 RepID=A0ABS4TG01_9PSEU|nr:hypothetical protein [Kibdelosporangium banguiense]MBP2323299.1 hypothetical protein [Kibdelosporangium banguiense]
MVNDVERVSTIRRVLHEHRETSGMRVAAGWTCRCGHWATGRPGKSREDHWAAVVVEALRGRVTGPAERVGAYLDELDRRVANGGNTDPERIHSFGLDGDAARLLVSDLHALLAAVGEDRTW